MAFGFVVGVFEQYAERRLFIERYAQLGKVFVHQAERKLAHHLKTRQPRTQVLVRQAQQRHGVFHRRHGSPCCEARCGNGVELQGRGGNDAQRAFAPDKQIAQVVAGIVFSQAGEAVPDLALRGDDFNAQAQLARIAVAHDLRAACVGGQVAANRAAALGGQAEREEKTGLLGRIL